MINQTMEIWFPVAAIKAVAARGARPPKTAADKFYAKPTPLLRSSVGKISVETTALPTAMSVWQATRMPNKAIMIAGLVCWTKMKNTG